MSQCDAWGVRCKSTPINMESANHGACEYVLGKGFMKRKSPSNWGPVDYILVCKQKIANKPLQFQYMKEFLDNIVRMGFKVEVEAGVVFKDLIFIKVYGRDILKQYADALNFNLVCRSRNYYIKPKVYFKFMATDLTRPDQNSDLYRRAPKSFSGEKPNDITTCERITIIYMLLERLPYGDNYYDYGIENLINNKTFVTAYPLHDGPFEWSEEGKLNDRQLLMRYWSHIRLWNKQQPVDLVNCYFGPEIGYYFAFIGFYNKMLIPAAIVGVLCFGLGLAHSFFVINTVLTEVCNSTTLMCPNQFKDKVQLTELKSMCKNFIFIEIFDNPLTGIFSIFMFFWGAVFLPLWMRYRSVLMYRWNISFIETYEERPQFQKKAKHTRRSSITGVEEYYIPKYQLIKNYLMSFLVCFILVLILNVVTYGIIVFKVTSLSALRESKLFNLDFHMVIQCTAALINIIFIRIFSEFYEIISLKLTNKENHRTQQEFDNSYIYKCAIATFFIHFYYIAYTAFVQGKFSSYPKEEVALFKKDHCHPGGCIMGLCIELAMLILFKMIFADFASLLFIPVERCLTRRFMHRVKRSDISRAPRWEQDYHLFEEQKNQRYWMTDLYIKILTQFGLVTFFVVAFPLGPLCALLGNLIKLRMDAYKLIKFQRRPVPYRQDRMKPLHTIIKLMAILSIMTNTLLVTFTSNFLKRVIYFIEHGSLKGYLHSSFSVFAVKDFDFPGDYEKTLNDTCYYVGHRYPYDHPKKYELNETHWQLFSKKLITAIIMEHVLLIIFAIMRRVIPWVPFSIKSQISAQYKLTNRNRIERTRESIIT